MKVTFKANFLGEQQSGHIFDWFQLTAAPAEEKKKKIKNHKEKNWEDNQSYTFQLLQF